MQQNCDIKKLLYYTKFFKQSINFDTKKFSKFPREKINLNFSDEKNIHKEFILTKKKKKMFSFETYFLLIVKKCCNKSQYYSNGHWKCAEHSFYKSVFTCFILSLTSKCYLIIIQCKINTSTYSLVSRNNNKKKIIVIISISIFLQKTLRLVH